MDSKAGPHRTRNPTRRVILTAALAALPKGRADADDGTLELRWRLNALRRRHRFAPVRENEMLSLSATLHAQELATRGVLDHASGDGRSFADRAREAGYLGRPVAENIAWNQQTTREVFEAWRASPGHLANMLIRDVDAFGFASHDASSGVWWVLVLGLGQ
jgi:uncharacterized protein YkwD